MRRRGREPLTEDEFDRRPRSCTLVGPSIFDQNTFALATPITKPKVMFRLRERRVDKSNLGMRSGGNIPLRSKVAVRV